ncbi:hypothetical protein PLACP1_22440 [Planifilum fimeticola]
MGLFSFLFLIQPTGRPQFPDSEPGSGSRLQARPPRPRVFRARTRLAIRVLPSPSELLPL